MVVVVVVVVVGGGGGGGKREGEIGCGAEQVLLCFRYSLNRNYCHSRLRKDVYYHYHHYSYNHYDYSPPRTAPPPVPPSSPHQHH